MMDFLELTGVILFVLFFGIPVINMSFRWWLDEMRGKHE